MRWNCSTKLRRCCSIWRREPRAPTLRFQSHPSCLCARLTRPSCVPGAHHEAPPPPSRPARPAAASRTQPTPRPPTKKLQTRLWKTHANCCHVLPVQSPCSAQLRPPLVKNDRLRKSELRESSARTRCSAAEAAKRIEPLMVPFTKPAAISWELIALLLPQKHRR